MSSDNPFNSVERALQLVGSFEAELLLELMLRYWSHPQADDRYFRNGLLETMSEVLLASSRGETFIDGLSPKDMNFVAAAWFIESTAHADSNGAKRAEWAVKVRQAVPSCFVDEDHFNQDDSA